MNTMKWSGSLLRVGSCLVLLGCAAGVCAYGSRRLLPAADQVAAGTLLAGEPLSQPDAAAAVDARAEALLARRVVLRHGDSVLIDTRLGDLGARVDRARAVRELQAVGREGGWLERLDDAWQARSGQRQVTLSLELPVETLAEQLSEFKARFDHKPHPARWDFERGAASEHENGEMVDVYAAAELIRHSVSAGDVDAAVPLATTAPAATRQVVEAIDMTAVVSQFETRFGFQGNQAGRAKNVRRAAAGIHGLVMMPGEVVSFNELVGPRSLENGFAEAGEIYKGEMRMGIGGGTCQVASTFHAAAYFGGLNVVERSPHSRPSGYIGIGLDATVAYPHVDLKMSNPFDFPVVVKSSIIDGGTLRVEILGREDVADVDYAAATVGVKPYKRKIREAHWLSEGEVKIKQAGRRGVTIERTRTIRYVDGKSRVETTRDDYPPTNEVYFVPAGSDPDSLLPPLPDQSGPEQSG